MLSMFTGGAERAPKTYIPGTGDQPGRVITYNGLNQDGQAVFYTHLQMPNDQYDPTDFYSADINKHLPFIQVSKEGASNEDVLLFVKQHRPDLYDQIMGVQASTAKATTKATTTSAMPATAQVQQPAAQVSSQAQGETKTKAQTTKKRPAQSTVLTGSLGIPQPASTLKTVLGS